MAETRSTSLRRDPILDMLSDKFEVVSKCQPLALGIHKEILVRLPDLDPAALRSSMRIHTASTRYLKELATSTVRFDLDGQPAGEVTVEQRDVASGTLRERFKKLADRRRAEDKATSEAQRELQSAQERQEKLAQLAARFNSR